MVLLSNLYMKSLQKTSFYQDVYALVRQSPKSTVTTYGFIALQLGKPQAARAVGYALNAIKKSEEQDIPWHRVINSKGEISFKGDAYRAILQKKLLEEEGIFFDETSKVDLKKFGWKIK
jgi:methylated-DNA-protein-cysteine methyltransferase related protein